MNTKSLLIASAIALAASAAIADDFTHGSSTATSQTTRSEVKASVQRARAAGQLIPAGEGFNPKPEANSSTVSRSTVKDEVLTARVSGRLVPAGEGSPQAISEFNTPSTLTRAEVKAEVLAARQAGELVPAGEGADVVAHTKHVNGNNTLTALVARFKHAASQ